MARSKRGLGRGLGSLITTPKKTTTPAEDGSENGLQDLPVASITPSPWQPRSEFDEDALQALADSIREQGLVQPVIVRQNDQGYELVAGERRWRAVKRLGWTTVQAVVMEASDERMRELALVENLQRQDLNPLETAYAYQSLQDELGLTHEQVASRLGVSRSAVTNMLRLLELPDEVKRLIAERRLRAGHARAILAMPEAMSQIKLARKAADEGMSVRELETLTMGGGQGKKKTAQANTESAPKKTDPLVQDLEDRLRTHLGTKVSVRHAGKRGSIVIEYYSPEDATRILERMGLPADPS